MHPDLEKLIHLQRAESDLRRVQDELGQTPRARAEIDGRLAAERARVDAAKEALAASQKARRGQEGELQDLEQKRSKYKGQLMEVKTNKEYSAMLHEIEAVEREIRSREDLILVEMERAETLSAELKREEALFKSVEEAHRGELEALVARQAELDVQAARLTAERDEMAKAVPDDVLELFQRVAKRRGTGLAEAKDEMCLVCHVRLRPQMYVEIRRNEQIVQCPSCSRILYYEPPPPTVDPQP